MADKMTECRWLKPHLVAQIEYADWIDVNHLRHSKFIALRDDKPARMWAEVDKMLGRSGTPDALDVLQRQTYANRFGGFRTASDERSSG